MKRSGFTLVELLVVISIITLLATIGYATYSNAQIAARDGRRKEDLRDLQVALELYRQKNGHFPCTNDNALPTWHLSMAGSFWITDHVSCSPTTPLDSNYINQMPKDPTANNGNPAISNVVFGYAYRSDGVIAGGSCPPSPTQGKYYILVTRLENSNDQDSNAQKQYKDCSGSPVTSNPNAYVVVNP